MGGTEREKSINKAICYFSTADSSMDLSKHRTAELLIIQSCGWGHRFL